MLHIYGESDNPEINRRLWTAPIGPIRPNDWAADYYDRHAIVPYMEQRQPFKSSPIEELVTDSAPSTATWRVMQPPEDFARLASRLGVADIPDAEKTSIVEELALTYDLRYVNRRESVGHMLTTTIADSATLPGLHLDLPRQGAPSRTPVRWGYNAGPGARDSLAIVAYNVAELRDQLHDDTPLTTDTLKRYCSEHIGALLCVGLRIQPGEAYCLPAQAPTGYAHDGSTHGLHEPTIAVFFDHYGDPATIPNGFSSQL